MKFTAKNVTTKYGKEIIVREAKESDAEILIANAKSLIENASDTIILENFNPSLEDEHKWINSFAKQKNNLLLLAVYDEQVIGNIEIRTPALSKTKHTSLLAMGIVKEWRNKGIGSILMESMINWAKENTTIEILWLQVFASNEPAIALYKKMGFTVDGIQKDFIKLDKNTYTDSVNMSKKL